MPIPLTTIEKGKKIIKESEGCKLTVYKDSVYKLDTIGIGHRIWPGEKFDKITEEQAEKLFNVDYQKARGEIIEVFGEDTFSKLSSQRQVVLLDMVFNMGKAGLSKYVKFIEAVKKNNFEKASLQILDSDNFSQIKSRCLRNAYIMKQNKIYTKSQAINKGLRDQIIYLPRKGEISYAKKDTKIQNIMTNKSVQKTDIEIAKQIDKIKNNNMIGGVSFDIDVVATRLNGLVLDGSNIKILQGDIYDESSYTFMDLVTPLKIMYDPEIKSKNFSVSLDPEVPNNPDGPWFAKVFYPKELAHTCYGEDMIEADYLMKRLSLGVDENNEPYQYPERLNEMGLNIQKIAQSVSIKDDERKRTRLWIVIKDYEVGLNENFIEVKNIKMGVELKALQVGEDGTLRDCNDKPSQMAKIFCQIFTENYDELCEYYPILNRMKRLAKASIIAKMMYMKRVPIDLNLINKLHEKQKRETEQRLPKLSNELRKQIGDKAMALSVFGGCSFDVHDMQNKIQKVEEQIKQLRKVYKKKINKTQSLEQKQSYNILQEDKENIPINTQLRIKSEGVGHFTFVTNEQDIIENSTAYPFLFQELVQCKYCNKLCGLDYYSIQNRECVDHSSMKCQICRKIILAGQPYKSNADKSMIFHEQCLTCSKCSNKINGPYANIEGKRYHPDCVPKIQVGKCEECKKQIYQGEPYAQNPQTSLLYHQQCAQIVNKRIQDSIPNCRECGKKISGRYVKIGNDSYDEECAKKKFNVI